VTGGHVRQTCGGFFNLWDRARRLEVPAMGAQIIGSTSIAAGSTIQWFIHGYSAPQLMAAFTPRLPGGYYSNQTSLVSDTAALI
jgi:hypothetical protein